MSRNIRTYVALAFTFLTSVACIVSGTPVGLRGVGPTRGGTFAEVAWIHGSYPLAIRYHDATAKALLGPKWRLDNYYVATYEEANGESMVEKKALVPKKTDAYYYDGSFDTNGDGRPDVTQRLPRHAILLKNRETNATIRLAALPIGVEHADKDLRVLLNSLVESMAGSGLDIAVFSNSVVAVERRFAARIVHQGPAEWFGVSAWEASIEVANLDQLELTPDMRWSRARIIVARPQFVYRPRKIDESYFPILMMYVYTNDPVDFDRQMPEFESLLQRTYFLNDAQVVALEQSSLAQCVDSALELKLSISQTGSLDGLLAAKGDACLLKGLASSTFASTGSNRTATVVFDPRSDAHNLRNAGSSYRGATPPPPSTPAATPAPETPADSPTASTAGPALPAPGSANAADGNDPAAQAAP